MFVGIAVDPSAAPPPELSMENVQAIGVGFLMKYLHNVVATLCGMFYVINFFMDQKEVGISFHGMLDGSTRKRNGMILGTKSMKVLAQLYAFRNKTRYL